jgi:DNA mismatch repair protein MSH5
MERQKERFPNVSRRLFPPGALGRITTVSQPSSSSYFQSSPLSTRPRRLDSGCGRLTSPSLPPLQPLRPTSDSTPSGRSSTYRPGAATQYAGNYGYLGPILDTSSHDEDVDVLNETILAVDMKEDGLIGCAYYVAIDESLSLQEDVAMAGAEFAETLVMHAKPTTILISSKAPESLVSVLEAGSQILGEQRRGKAGGSQFLTRLS